MREPVALSNVVVIGGGPGGASAACRLARAGRPVLIIERDSGPTHKVCGEFLSGDALTELSESGVDIASTGASPIHSVRLVHHRRVAEAKLPFDAAGLSRFALDEALLQRASLLGADLLRGERVRTCLGGTVHTDQRKIQAASVLLATGKDDLRGIRRQLANEPEALIGFKMHLRLSPAQQAELKGWVEVVLFAGGYAGIQCIEGGLVNLCLLCRQSRFQEAGRTWTGLLGLLQREASHLATRLAGAVQCWQRPLSVSRVPFGFIHDHCASDDVYRIGDQAAVIPSFCGDGLAIALRTGRMAADAVLAGDDAATYHRRVRQVVAPSVRLASGVYQLTKPEQVRRILVSAARTWPGILTLFARLTRVSVTTDFATPSA